jgi:hypothetical protein
MYWQGDTYAGTTMLSATLPAAVLAAEPYTTGMDLSVHPDYADLALLADSTLTGADKRALGTRVSAALSRRWAAIVEVRVGFERPSTGLWAGRRLEIRLPFPEAAKLIARDALAEEDERIAGIRGRLRALGKQPPVRGGVDTHLEIRGQIAQDNAVWQRWLHLALTGETPRWASVPRSAEAACPSRTAEAHVDWEAAAAANCRTPGVLVLLQREKGIGESKIRRPACITPTHSHYRHSPLSTQESQAKDQLHELDPLLSWWRAHEQETALVLELLVSIYGCFAATAAPEVLQRYLPELAGLARQATEPGRHRFMLSSVVALHAHRLEGTQPRELTCPFCATRFLDETLGEDLVRWCGPPRWCSNCAQDNMGASWYQPANLLSWTRESASSYLRAEHERTGMLPALPWQPTGWLESCADPLALVTDIERDVDMLRCVTAPTRYTLSRLWPGGTAAVWLGAGLTDLVRTNRGAVSIAADGHACRSILERHVDDWLSSHHIAHSCEPAWPSHPTLNPGGSRRADWLLEGDVYVEMAGMLDDPSYAAKIEHKRHLANALGVELLVLTPDDVARLDLLLPGQRSVLRPRSHAPAGSQASIVTAAVPAADVASDSVLTGQQLNGDIGAPRD